MTEAILQRLMQLYPRAIDLGLERIERLLAEMGSPHKKLPPVVHIAGTNGKGSLVAYLRAMSEAAGYRAHVYTSPHLVRFNERIRVAGRLIEDDELAAVLTECEEVNAGKPITFFEITTVAAFVAFARVPADHRHPRGRVGRPARHHQRRRSRALRDHADRLRPHRFPGRQARGHRGRESRHPEARRAGGDRAPARGERRRSSPPRPRSSASRCSAWAANGRWRRPRRASATKATCSRSTCRRPRSSGAHQLDNAATAVACIERLRAAKFAIDDKAIRKGLASVEWPARLQKLTRGPLVEALPPGCELWLDGGHNEDCGIALARMASDWAKEPAPLPLYLVFGMLTTKDASGFLRPLARHAQAARAVPFPEGHSAYTPVEACAKAAEVGLDCVPTNDIGAALEDLLATQPAPMRILICGSLYLAGAVLARNG